MEAASECLPQQMAHRLSPDAAGGPCGFTVRTVYCCDICGLEVSDQEKITQHVVEHHNDAESDNRKVCMDPAVSQQQQQDDVTSSSTVLSPKRSRRNSTYKRSASQDVLESADSKPLVCPECGRIYKYVRCFERHIAQKHKAQSTSLKTVGVLQCKATSSELLSDAHNSADVEAREEESRENYTDDLLNDSHRLELQEVTDILDDVLTDVSDDKQNAPKLQMAPYCCAECPKRFETRRSLQLHTIDKHTGWTCVCNSCGQLFVEGSELRSHTITDHNKIPDDSDTGSLDPVLGSHCCVICGFRYRSEEELAKHTASHDNSLPAFACTMCSGRYLTKSGLRCHVRRVHSGDRPYLCELCGDRFITADERSAHVKQHGPELCTLCGVRLRRLTADVGATMCSVCYLEQLSSRDGAQVATVDATAKTLTQRYAHTSPLPLKYSCSFCGIRFVWRSNLRRHERKHTTESHRPQPVDTTEAPHFQCCYCSRVFNQAGRLRKHILRHVEPNNVQQPSFYCKLCGQRFLWKKSLIRHLRIAHPPSLAHHIPIKTSASTVMQCDSTIASSLSAEADGIKSNSSRESDGSGGQFGSYRKCTHRQTKPDEMIAPSKDEVPSGKSQHKVVMPCPECGCAFFWRSNLLRHIREQHQGNETSSRCRTTTDAKHLQCNRCGRRFSRLSYLRVHLQAHENVDKSGGVRSDSLLCSVCGQTMTSARLLRIHMLRHAGVRPHQCQMCDKSFFVVAELNTHVSVVHRGNRFVCDQCGHEANSKSALKLHSRSVHPVPGVEPSFPCSACSRRFWSPAALRRHADAHDVSRLSIRKAMCAVCSTVFRHVYNLSHHIETTHADVDCSTPFACATCHQQFDSGPAFKTHYRSKHRNR